MASRGSPSTSPPALWLGGASEILDSSTVRDLVIGSELTFAESGEHELKGVPGRWTIWAATWLKASFAAGIVTRAFASLTAPRSAAEYRSAPSRALPFDWRAADIGRVRARHALRRVFLLLAALTTLALLFSASAGAYVYWANYTSGATIGRANLNGTGANQSFISGASQPEGVAVDATHVYWANAATNTIGRANSMGGSEPELHHRGRPPRGGRSMPPISTGPTSTGGPSGVPTSTARERTRASSPGPMGHRELR